MSRIRLGNHLATFEGNVAEEAQVRRHLSYRPSGYQFSSAYKRRIWDGWKSLYSARSHSFPAGLAWDMARQLAADGHEPPAIDDERGPAPTPLPSIVTLPRPARFQLEQHQQEAIAAIQQRTRGVVHQATGAGKSVVIVEVVRALGVPSLVVVGRKELLNQQIKQFQALGFPNKLLGKIGDGVWQPNLVTVATVQTLTRRLRNMETAGETLEMLKTFQSAHFDECHHLPSASFGLLAATLSSAYYRIGYSATPYRSGTAIEETRLWVTGLTGPRLNVLSSSDGIEAGRLVPAFVYMVETPGADPDEIVGYYMRGGKRIPRYDYQRAVRTGIVENAPRNDLVADLAGRLAAHGPTIVLTERIAHASALRSLLLEQGHEEAR